MLGAFLVAGDSTKHYVCNEMADIVFVVDSSGSINEGDPDNWSRLKNFTKMVVDQLKIGRNDVRIGMVEFGNEAHIQFYLNTHYNADDIKADIERFYVYIYSYTPT